MDRSQTCFPFYLLLLVTSKRSVCSAPPSRAPAAVSCSLLSPFSLSLPLPARSPSLLLSALYHVVVGIMCSGCQLCQARSCSAHRPAVYLLEELNKLEEGLKLYFLLPLGSGRVMNMRIWLSNRCRRGLF